MKFQEIEIGTRFGFEGEEYVKTSAMLATSSAGKQRLIRRSVNLTSLDAATTPIASSQAASDSVDRQQALQAFEIFYQACIQVAGEDPRLASARQHFLSALE